MFPSLKRLLALTVIAACPAPVTAADPAALLKAPDKAEFVKKAIYEGLADDGVAPKFAAILADNPDFVDKCQLCDQTRAALKDFAKLRKAPAAKEGKGLPAELARKLASTDKGVRAAALRDLVDRYVAWGYIRYDLTADQKADLEKFVQAMKFTPKDGVLPNGLKYCPSCDGACKARPKVTQ